MQWLKLFGLLKALFKGQALFNAATWKNVQVTTESLVVLAVAILAFFPNIQASEAQILAICSGIALMVSTILTIATTTKIGLPAKGKLYDYIKNKAPEPINHDDIAITNDGVQFQPTDREMANVVRGESKPNSVNSGGKGLLGR